MTIAIGFQTFRAITVPIGESRFVAATGDYVVCYQANHSSFDLSFDEGAPIEFFQGAEIKIAKPEGGEQFGGLRITNTDGSTVLTVSMGVGFAEFRDRRLTVTGGVTVAIGADITTAADQAIATGANATVLAVNLDRKFALVQNLHATNSVRVLEVGAIMTRGIRIGPGEALRLETTAAIIVRNDSGASVDIAVMEVEN